jgi:hypothetical protein
MSVNHETGDTIRNKDQIDGLKKMIEELGLEEGLGYHSEEHVY